MHDPIETFTSVTAAVADVVTTEPDPLAPTPCPDWNYAQLLGHVVGGDRLFARILTGQGGPPPKGARMAPDPDRPAPSPADYAASSGRLAELLSDETIRGGVYRVPVGTLPGTQVVVLRTVEHFLHGWDLAKAAGAPTGALARLADQVDGPAHGLLAAVGDKTLGERRPFGPPVELDPVPAGSEESDGAGAASSGSGAGGPALDRLVAAFGRDPRWQPDPDSGYARVQEQFLGRDDVELPDGTRRGFGADGMRIGGSVFACSHRGRLMLKLPEEEVNGLIGAGLGLPLAKPGQRPMREWVLVPFDGAAGRRAERAYAFAHGDRASCQVLSAL